MGRYNNGKSKEEKFNDFYCRYKLIIYVAIFLIIGVIAILIGVYEYKNPRAEITDGYIKRPYSQLLRVLDDAPADITKQPYEEVLPDLVREDIQRMLDSNEEIDILYYGEQTCIKIYGSEDEITFNISKKDGWTSDYHLDRNISMYKSGDTICIYGTEYGERTLDYYYKVDQMSIEWDLLDNDYIDLYGAENVEYDDVRYYQKEMTIVRKGNDFKFYRLGEQVGETVHFPGGKIIDYDYCYILDDKNDLYYMYFNSHPSNPWIRFVKVDSDVSEVNCDEECVSVPYLDENGHERSLKYPSYIKNGIRYAGISNIKLETAYGNNHGINYDTLDPNTFDYNIAVIDLSKENISNAILNLNSYDDDWFVRYNYADTVYIEKRVNGLDSYLVRSIPEKELKKFDGKEIQIEEFADVIAKLKELYDKYS